MSTSRLCRCNTAWCWLDALFGCHWRYACDRHDAHMLSL